MLVSQLNSAFTLAFVISSMFGLGLSLTLRELLIPLKNRRLVGAAIAINFVLIPGIAWLLVTLMPLDPSLKIGLVIFSAVSGAPLGIKAAQIALADATSAGSLVVLQVLGSVLFLPIALPIFIPGIELNTWDVANSLFLQVLLPIALGVLVNSRYSVAAEMVRPTMGQIANVSLAGLLFVNLTRIPQILGLIGTGAIFAVLVVIAVGLAAGVFWPGIDPKLRKTLGLVSAQRNFAAAFVIAQGSFADQADVFVMILMASILSMIVILLVAGEFRRRTLPSHRFTKGKP